MNPNTSIRQEDNDLNLKSCEKKEKNVAEMIVEVSHEEFDAAMGEAYKKNRASISVPGFRKGKAPRKIVERMYGASIFYNDALDIIVPEVLSFVGQNETAKELKLASMPSVTDIDIKDDTGDVHITLAAALYPEVTLAEYKGLSAVRPKAEVTDLEIDTEIESTRLRNARIETVSRPAALGDTAVINFEGFVDGVPFDGGKGEDYELVLGSNTFIPGFEDKVQGMAAGEERDIDVVFPENYSEPLAGKPAVFKVKLNEVREQILPELDDEFAKDVSEFDTLKEYKADIRENILKSRTESSDAAFENALMEKIVETMTADVPDAMVEDQMESSMNNMARQLQSYGMTPEKYLQMMNMTPEQFRENMRESSDKQVRVMLALERIAELENIEISDEDIETEYNEAAVRYGTEVEQVKESVEKDMIVKDLKMRRAAEIVTDSAIAEDPPAESEDKPKTTKKPAAKKTTATKSAETDAEKPKTAKKPAAKKTEDKAETAKTPAKKPATKTAAKTTEKSAETPAKKPAAKKTTATKSADADAEKPKTVKKPAAKKTEDGKAAPKTAAKKPAEKSTAAKSTSTAKKDKAE